MFYKLADLLEQSKLRVSQDGPNEQNEGQAQELPGAMLGGVGRDGTIGERGEKDAGGDDSFPEDMSRISPETRRIWHTPAPKIGHVIKRADYSTFDIEDTNAMNQSYWNAPAREAKTEEDVGAQTTQPNGAPGDVPIMDDATDEKQVRKPPKSGILVTKEAFALQGHTEVQGLPIAIENKAGSIRRGVDSHGKSWATKMTMPYGYIKGTEGADGDGVDVFVGPDKEADKAFVVHQKNPDTEKYDEDKVFLGLQSKKDAKEAFADNYDKPEKFMGPISEVPIDRLKELVESKRKLVKISSAMRFCLDELYKIDLSL